MFPCTRLSRSAPRVCKPVYARFLHQKGNTDLIQYKEYEGSRVSFVAVTLDLRTNPCLHVIATPLTTMPDLYLKESLICVGLIRKEMANQTERGLDIKRVTIKLGCRLCLALHQPHLLTRALDARPLG